MIDVATLTGLVNHYSPSGSEHGAVNWLAGRMKTLGYTEAFVDEAGNAIGVMGKGGKQIVLLGHIDTVIGEIPVRVEEGILYGRGSVDAKGPLACFVDAVAQVGAVDGWQLVVIGAVEEERDSEGARYVVSRYKPDFAVVGEPNRWDRIALGYKGSAWAKLSIKRSQAHTSSGEQTACEAAVGLWLAVKAYADSFNGEEQKAFDKILVTLRGLESSADGFEQWANLNIGARLPMDVSPEDWYGQLKEIAAEAMVERHGYAIPAWSCEKNTPMVRALLNGIRSTGGTPSFVYKTGSADLNIVAPAWKCPAAVYGPGDSALDHTPDEHLSLDEYEKALTVLSAALRKLISPA
jgi:[amino group carrier protein]-lysine/ornithine hydrolase